MQVEHTNKQ